jgi:hypothetical protein
MSSSVTYANIVTKQAVENWADQRGLVAEDQLTLHLEERFGARTESMECSPKVDPDVMRDQPAWKARRPLERSQSDLLRSMAR